MKFRRWIGAIALGSFGGGLTGSAAQANPIVPQSGSPTQVQQAGNEFTITGGVSSADGQALFHTFEQLGLSQGQIATFLAQPEVRSLLGGIVGGEASYIDGLLRVTGSPADLYLINPAGILFGPNAQLDLAGSFAATTASGVLFDDTLFNVLGNDDFSQLTGTPTGFVFALNEAGAIVNAANLTVTAGETITLMGGQVISTGTLTAPGGEITIAAIPDSNLVRISHPDGVLNLEVATLPAGAIAAGNALMPLSLPALLTGAPATIATGLAIQPDGTIALTNSDTTFAPVAGSAIAAGTLDTSGTVGGEVIVVGDRVALLNATVNASGTTGSGTVRLGGDYQGQPTLPGSSLTYVDVDSQITASADRAGDGGDVILWSDGTTAFYGDIAAQGGSTTGDGGFVEVSGAQTLKFRGAVDTTAPNGAMGTLLLDPTDITILNGTADGDDTDAFDNILSEPTVGAGDLIPTEIYESELEGLNGNTNVTLEASNNITIADLTDDNELNFQSGTGSITFAAGGIFQMLDANDFIVAADNRDITITASAINAGNFDTRGAVSLTATSTDIVVSTIFADDGITINAARQFQAIGSRVLLLSTRLEAATDGDLIEFLSQGDPNLLVDAGLVDGSNPDPFQTRLFIPMSLRTDPSGGGDASIVITHGGQAITTNLDGGNLLIQGTGAFPNIQFVVGPQNDHDITITNPGTNLVNGVFDNFSTLYPVGGFPANLSGATGAIVRQATDSTLVTSFQNQPFVPIIDGGGGTTGGGTTGGGTTGGGTTGGGTTGGGSGSGGGGTLGGQPAIAPGLNFETATFENLTPDNAETDVEDLEEEEDAAALTTEDAEAEDCAVAIANRSANTVEITSTCAALPVDE